MITINRTVDITTYDSILGIYVLSLGVVSVVSGSRLLENLSFFQLHAGGTASIFIGIFMLLLGNGLRARTRISWYFAIFFSYIN